MLGFVSSQHKLEAANGLAQFRQEHCVDHEEGLGIRTQSPDWIVSDFATPFRHSQGRNYSYREWENVHDHNRTEKIPHQTYARLLGFQSDLDLYASLEGGKWA
jgi:hypothetical protein